MKIALIIFLLLLLISVALFVTGIYLLFGVPYMCFAGSISSLLLALLLQKGLRHE